MKTRSRSPSGVVSIRPEGDVLSLGALMVASHDILNAAAALLMNVELLAEHTRESVDGPSIADDARASVQRIAAVIGVIQAAARARVAAA